MPFLNNHAIIWICLPVLRSVCRFACLGVPRAHYTPLQRYMGYLCTRKAQYAPSRHNMHHGAQGRLCFLKNSGDPDDFLFWWFTENIRGTCAPSGRNMHHQGAMCTMVHKGDYIFCKIQGTLMIFCFGVLSVCLSVKGHGSGSKVMWVKAKSKVG